MTSRGVAYCEGGKGSSHVVGVSFGGRGHAMGMSFKGLGQVGVWVMKLCQVPTARGKD